MMRHDDNVSELSQQLGHLIDVAFTIERRLLHLVKEGTQKTIPPEDIVSELGLLAKEVARCHQRRADFQERRDLGFKTEARLKELQQQLIWLRRKIQVEQGFFQRWHLETKLRAQITPEAFSVYQEIIDAEQLSREFLMRSDAEIERLLRIESGRCAP